MGNNGRTNARGLCFIVYNIWCSQLNLNCMYGVSRTVCVVEWWKIILLPICLTWVTLNQLIYSFYYISPFGSARVSYSVVFRVKQSITFKISIYKINNRVILWQRYTHHPYLFTSKKNFPSFSYENRLKNNTTLMQNKSQTYLFISRALQLTK